MVNQYVWIGIVVGIFFVGIGVGHSIQSNTLTVPMMTSQQMTKMMNQNHDFMQQMMMEMINDPNIRLQMIGHMTENPEMMQQLSKIMTGNMTEMMNQP